MKYCGLQPHQIILILLTHRLVVGLKWYTAMSIYYFNTVILWPTPYYHTPVLAWRLVDGLGHHTAGSLDYLKVVLLLYCGIQPCHIVTPLLLPKGVSYWTAWHIIQLGPNISSMLHYCNIVAHNQTLLSCFLFFSTWRLINLTGAS